MCFVMLSISLSHWLWVTLCHSWCKNSLALFDGLWPLIIQTFVQANLVCNLIHASFRKMNPALLKHPQIITDPPRNFTVGARHCGRYTSPGLYLTIRRPGVGQSWKFDSSEKISLLQSSMVQSFFSSSIWLKPSLQESVSNSSCHAHHLPLFL